MDKKFLYGFLVCFMLTGLTVFAQGGDKDATAGVAPEAMSVPVTNNAVAVDPAAVPAPQVPAPAPVSEPVAPSSADVSVPAVSAVSAVAAPVASAVSANTVVIQGTISEIAADGTSLTVNDGAKPVKFSTTKDFIEEAYMEVGDKVKITAEKTADGFKLLDYDYVFDDATYADSSADQAMDADAEKPRDTISTPAASASESEATPAAGVDTPSQESAPESGATSVQ